MSKEKQQVIKQTQAWLNDVIIAHNYCPFAKREVDKGSIRFQVFYDTETEETLKDFITECVWLDRNSDTETTLIIFPESLKDFNLFLELLSLVENLLVAQGYEGVYQVASFHPDYCFQGAETDDAANYTNRSPYPMLHLIREASMEKALKSYPNPEDIPEKNIKFAREQGLEKMRTLLQNCLSVKD